MFNSSFLILRFAGGSQWGLVSDIVLLPRVQGLGEFSMNIQNCSDWSGQCFISALIAMTPFGGHCEAHSFTVELCYVHTSPRES